MTGKILLDVRAMALAAALAAVSFAPSAGAATVVLDSSIQCSAGNAVNGIAVGDVTGDAGGASECWGTLDGNDPGPNGAFEIDGMTFDYVAKQNTPGSLEGEDIGLSVSPSGGALSGTWEFDGDLLGAEAFLIVLKAANSPGFAVWLFEGADALSDSGSWLVAWSKDLSHLTIYSKDGVPQIPIPAALPLFLTALAGAGLMARRRKDKS